MVSTESKRGVREPFLEGTILGRTQFLEVVAGALVLAFGVNLLASRLIETWRSGAFWVGLACTVGPIAYLVWRFAGGRTRVGELVGFLMYDKKRNAIIPVARYEYSESLARYLKALLAENPAFQRLWDDQPLKEIDDALWRGESRAWKAAEL